MPIIDESEDIPVLTERGDKFKRVLTLKTLDHQEILEKQSKMYINKSCLSFNHFPYLIGQNEILAECEQIQADLEADIKAAKAKQRAEYNDMIGKTKIIPLEKLLYSNRGCQLFDELCLRIDINQQVQNAVY